MQEKKLKKVFIILLFAHSVIFSKTGHTQEMLGVTLGNYSGVASLMVNPAMLANTRYYLDINLASADFFFRNNFAYIPASDASIYSIIRNTDNLPTYGPDDLNFTYYDNKRLKFNTLSTKVLGPSVMLQYGKHAFALSTGAQLFTSANRIPYEMPLFGYFGMDEPSLHNINYIDYNIDANVAAWMNVGGSYAYTVYEYLDQKITFGGTVRYIWSYAGAYMESSNVNYIVLNDSTINIKNLNGVGGFALPIDYSTSDQMVNDPFFKGHGFGVDLGVVYVKKKNIDLDRWDELCEQEFDDYIFRIGVSVLDLGTMTYKSNAELHSFDDVSVYWESYDTTGYTSINQLMGDLSGLFYNGDRNASYRGNKIKIGLPAAVSVQVDYNIYKNFYASAFWIHPIRFNMHTMRRPAQVALVPRYESKYFEFSLPISVYEYRFARVGLSARFWFLTIGTERLGTWLGLANLDGLDIYASIKFGFGKGFCRSKFKGACNEDSYKKKKRSKINKNLVF
ncbi:MAG: hypothetical protein DRI72_05890 [Bacteroidetes bacterium]|nr:MAG: hypothetical protein DRI72_05890 [Bacteroidota bacterium]RLD71235.1 MAG: hypothetical protein DRI87_07205 [Bacteroidota bacterium]